MITQMDKLILVTNIQRFSLHDGPGIRTTLFLKGCPVRCPWCSNPENLSPNVQRYIKDGKEGVYGQYYTPEELYAEIIKDRAFYGEELAGCNIKDFSEFKLLPGGATFSGGEFLLQLNALLPLFEMLKQEKIHMAAETSLFAPEDTVSKAISYINFFYVDIKILNKAKCSEILLGNSELFLRNLDQLLYSGKPVAIRIPVIGNMTDSDENRRDIIHLINKYARDSRANLLKIELIKEHNLGIGKYKSLSMCNEGYAIPEYRGVTDTFMEQYKDELKRNVEGDILIEICSAG